MTTDVYITNWQDQRVVGGGGGGKSTERGSAWLQEIDQLAVPGATDWLMTLIPANTGSPVPGEGRAAPGLTTPMQVVGWFWGQERAGAGDTLVNAKTMGARRVADLTIVKFLDAATPVLSSACSTNALIKEAKLIAFRAGGQSNDTQVEFFKMVAKDGALRSHYIYTSHRHGIPLEVFELNFKTLELVYTPQTVKGSKGGVTMTMLDVTAQQ